MASQKTWCLLSGTLLVSDPVELSVARETVQEAASPTSQLVKALKGAGLQNSDGRPLSPFPRAPKALQGGQKKAIPLTLSPWESKCQPSSIHHSSPGQSCIPWTPQCLHLHDGTQMLSPRGPLNQRHQPPPQEATPVLAGTAGPSSSSPYSKFHCSNAKGADAQVLPTGS